MAYHVGQYRAMKTNLWLLQQGKTTVGMDDVYNTYYDSIVEDGYDVAPYEKWSEESSACYKEWSDSSSSIYKSWSDTSSKLYDTGLL